jgi:hypothetical protein
MPSDARVVPYIPVRDLNRARPVLRGELGLKPKEEHAEHAASGA